MESIYKFKDHYFISINLGYNSLFGDGGQTFDPFVYLGLLSGQITKIVLCVASIITLIRHPAHVAKSATSIDQISGGRLILGVANGDRPDEYPAMNVSYQERGKLLRETYEYIRRIAETYLQLQNSFRSVSGNLDILPKPKATNLPLLITEPISNHQIGSPTTEMVGPPIFAHLPYSNNLVVN
ncbi:LLM class flavin-dependent oxidoreductase [Microbulbifer epialgicus]|uniref:LLM class flavin-dependent oxidoreductase n=1 Tax=Microbulbifer epialgicus TaxID=393907 RepID=A0ABV4P4S3_9GAMM